MPTEQIKHYCVSCGTRLFAGESLGACEHGLLCDICRYDSECPQCAKAEEGKRDMCVCCAHGQHGSHLIDAKCACMCHASNQRESALIAETEGMLDVLQTLGGK